MGLEKIHKQSLVPKVTTKELNLLLDGLEDTLIRLHRLEIKESEAYIFEIKSLKRKIEKNLKERSLGS